MEKFRELGGVILSKDPSATGGPEDPIHLTGGENLLRRGVKGYRRRPGFGAFDVESAAAVLHGSSITNARATFPFGGSVVGLHDGVLTKYDGSDSFDPVTKSLTDAVPTTGDLGGHKLIASGGRVLKYEGSSAPLPLCSKSIADFESLEVWADGGATADVVVDQSTADYVSGTQALRLVAGAAGDETALLGAISETDTYGYILATGGYLGLSDSSGVHNDFAMKVSGVAGRTITNLGFHVGYIGSTPLAVNVNIRMQYEGVDGLPDGVDIATAHVEGFATFTSLGAKSVVLSTPVPIADNGKDVFVIFDSDYATETGWARLSSSGAQPGRALKQDDGAWFSAWDEIYLLVTHKSTGAYGIDMYTGYPDASTVRISTKVLADKTNLTAGAATFIRFLKDSNNYYEAQIALADIGDASWSELTLTRGANNGDDGDFSAIGTPSWAEVSAITIGASFNAADTLYVDKIYLLHRWAPPVSSRVFVADGRAFVCSGRYVYYSAKWNPNVFEKDTYLQFPDDVVAVVQAGPVVLFLTDTEAWWAAPLPQFPDYRPLKLSMYGGVDPKAACEITYNGVIGAAWISKNAGAMFWPGEGEPIPISADIDDIFTEGGSNNQNFKYSRSSEVMMFYHHRFDELWILYPTLYTGETNLKYGWVLNCKTGKWMPRFVWNGTNNIVYACLYRDSNDSVYKVLLTDSAGAVFHEGYVGSTALSATTSVDGYVDASTPGADTNLVKGFVELPFVGGVREDKTDKDQHFHDINVKYLPNTTAAFALDFDRKLAAKGDIDDDTYHNEEEIIMPAAWTDIGSRSTTAASADTVIERNVKVGEDVIGHGLAVRVGQVDSGGTVEWELYGVGVSGYPRYGKR